MTTSGSPDEFPLVPTELMNALEAMFPMVDWEPTAELRDVQYHAGKRYVIRWLRIMHDSQREAQPDETEEPDDVF